MNGKSVGLAVVFAMAVAATPAMAHHSFAAEFDANRPVKLTATVTKIEWMNPHAYFYIDVKDGSGKVTSWGLEMGSPNGLMRQGWTRNSMKVGDEIVVEGSRAKDGSDIATPGQWCSETARDCSPRRVRTVNDNSRGLLLEHAARLRLSLVRASSDESR